MMGGVYQKKKFRCKCILCKEFVMNDELIFSHAFRCRDKKACEERRMKNAGTL
jgi:hypothetical protein